MLVGVIIGLCVTLGIYTVVSSNPPDETQKVTVEQPAERFHYADQDEVAKAREKQEEERIAKAELARAKAELAKAELVKAELAKEEQAKIDFINLQRMKANQAKLNAEQAKAETARALQELEKTRAEIAKAQLEKDIKPAAPALPHPAPEPTPVKVESTPVAVVAPVRQTANIQNLPWSVQIASLKTEKDAEEKLSVAKSKGFAAFVEAGDVNGATAYRVKLGPVATKVEAQDLLAQAIKHSEMSGAFLTKAQSK